LFTAHLPKHSVIEVRPLADGKHKRPIGLEQVFGVFARVLPKARDLFAMASAISIG